MPTRLSRDPYLNDLLQNGLAILEYSYPKVCTGTGGNNTSVSVRTEGTSRRTVWASTSASASASRANGSRLRSIRSVIGVFIREECRCRCAECKRKRRYREFFHYLSTVG